MRTHATGAPAPVHPNALSSRESATVRRALDIIESKKLKQHDVLYYFEDFERYLRLRFGGLAHEQGHVIYLDIDRRLIEADAIAFGHQSKVAWDIRHIAYRALALGAEHVVMAHNHPSDNPLPSEGDMNNFAAFENGLRMVGINLLESFVVTSKKITSIKQYKQQHDEMQTRRWLAENAQRREERRAKTAASRAARSAAQL